LEEEGDCIVCLEMRANELMRRLISGGLANYRVVRTSPKPLYNTPAIGNSNVNEPGADFVHNAGIGFSTRWHLPELDVFPLLVGNTGVLGKELVLYLADRFPEI
jgi:hypothetical protein